MSAITTRKNLIIWDWDDTIFPTYAFRTQQHQKDPGFMSKLKILVQYIEITFAKMIEIYGASNIIIVTNAKETWINMCLNVDVVQNIYMKFQNILKSNHIKTISASTSSITKQYPHNHSKWKEIVFRKYFKQYFDDKDDDSQNRIHCITSIGDSLYEYKASHSASKYLRNRILNRFLFKANPSLTDMIFEYKELLTVIDQIGSTLDDIEINHASLKTLSSFSDTTC